MLRWSILGVLTMALAFSQEKGNTTKAKGNDLIRPLAELDPARIHANQALDGYHE
jgi:hypothetical protein